MERFLAHIRPESGGAPGAVQTVEQHCRAAAEYAAQALEPVSLSAGGYLAGLVHDMGKYTLEFQQYLRDQAAPRGSVNHTFAAVRLLLERYHGEDSGAFANVVSELLALAAGQHHGLLNCLDGQKSGFQYRLEKEGIHYRQALENFLRFCAGPEELDRRFQQARGQLSLALERIFALANENEEVEFYAGLLARLLLSAVLEGDRRDTAEFMNGARFAQPQSGEQLERLWDQLLKRVEEKIDSMPQKLPIDRARREISQQCRRSAEQPCGVFRLNVPTGGGKTLSSLRFALAHARRNRNRRIIFTAPLLSILDQNADVIRRYIQDDSLILEHHSNLVREEEPEENRRQTEQRELLTETWQAPVIITTLVQLLNALFSGKTAAIRRFHALCGSVIVIDEVQTVPSKMLTLFSLAVNFLAELCGATVVLCSATQPCLERISHPLREPILDLVPYSAQLWEPFRRTEILDRGTMSLEQIACLARQRLETADSLLIVCNKKSQAQYLYEQLKGEDFALFPLSAAMCVAHRRQTLERLRLSLAQKGRKTLCVSTQVIEAGVDLSFARVIRLSAGMDSAVQAAGRCNRSGEAGPGALAPVDLVQCRQESLARLPDILQGQRATAALLAEFKNCPEQFGGRLDSDQAIGYYYRALYKLYLKGHCDYHAKGETSSLFSLLSHNEQCDTWHPYSFRQAFRRAGALFQVFEQDTADVIVPYGQGKELIQNLCGERARRDLDYLKKQLEQAKPYAVSLYQYQIDRMAKEGALIPLQGGALGLSGHYSEETGFFMGESDLEFLEV